MEFPAHIYWTILFALLGLFDGIFHFYSKFDRTFCKQTVETLIRLPCLYMSHILKDARLKWVKNHEKLFFNQNICCGYSKEPSQLDGSLEHSKQMLKNNG